MFGPCFAMQYLLSIRVLQPFAREKRAYCFILIVLLLSCDCSVPCLFLRVSLVGLQHVIVVFSGLLILRIVLRIAAYQMLYLTHRKQNSL